MTNQEFIKTIYPIIVQYAQKYGYNISVSCAICAQACIESAYGRSSLSAKYHNYFGLKCGSHWNGTSVNLKTKEEYTVGTLTSIKANFRAYSSIEEGVKGYFDFIQLDRYAPLRNCTSSLSYATTIKNCGYATSSTYVTTIMNTVNKYILPILNEVVVESYSTVKKGNRNSTVRILQEKLNAKGFSLACDGVFGTNTFNAVCAFQSYNKLTVDGICGKNTWTKILE